MIGSENFFSKMSDVMRQIFEKTDSGVRVHIQSVVPILEQFLFFCFIFISIK
jgi:hypothetical protein